MKRERWAQAQPTVAFFTSARPVATLVRVVVAATALAAELKVLRLQSHQLKVFCSRKCKSYPKFAFVDRKI